MKDLLSIVNTVIFTDPNFFVGHTDAQAAYPDNPENHEAEYLDG